MKNIWYYLHLLIIIFNISIIFFPIKYLKYIFFIPAALPYIWLLCDGCPLGKLHDEYNKPNILHEIYLLFFPKIEEKTAMRLTYAILFSIILISSLRIINVYGVYDNLFSLM